MACIEENDDFLISVGENELQKVEHFLESILAFDVAVLKRFWNFVLIIALFLKKKLISSIFNFSEF
jgi:hypothetical protein